MLDLQREEDRAKKKRDLETEGREELKMEVEIGIKLQMGMKIRLRRQIAMGKVRERGNKADKAFNDVMRQQASDAEGQEEEEEEEEEGDDEGRRGGRRKRREDGSEGIREMKRGAKLRGGKGERDEEEEEEQGVEEKQCLKRTKSGGRRQGIWGGRW